MAAVPIKPQLSVRSGNWSRLIEKLDVNKDAVEIESILFAHVFPLDFFIAAEIAQLRTFTIPSISRLLHQTGEYENDGLRRLIDTQVIMSKIIGPGPQSEEGQAMADHLNQIHGFFNIPNDDFLYVLSTFIFEPVLWVERYGWRELTDQEKEGLYVIYAEVGRALMIRDIPPSFDAYWTWRLTYEAKEQRFEESNRQVTKGMVGALQTFLPRGLRWLAFPLLASLLDNEFRQALGLPKPNPLFYATVQTVMWLRARINRHLNIWEEASFLDSPIIRGPERSVNPDPLQIGSPKLIEKINLRRTRSPAS